MAATEVETGARLFNRKPEANTWGVLNVREAFATANPDIVRRVLTVYETARKWSVAHPAELKASLVTATRLPDAVIGRQLERTDLSSGQIGAKQAGTIIEAGKALQSAGVLDAGLDMTAITNGMIDSSYGLAIGA
jgi:sulfonate transport system substrate-binding protein